MAEVPVAAATTVATPAVEARAVEVLRARAAAATVMEAVMVAMAEVHAEVSTAANWARAAAPKAVRVARVAHTSSGW